MALGVVLVLSVVAAVVVVVVVLTRPEEPYVWQDLVFEEPAVGIVLVRFPRNPFVQSGVDWLGDEPVALARVGGRPTSGPPQPEELAVIDPARKIGYHVVEPPHAAPQDLLPFRMETFVPPTPLASSLHRRILYLLPSQGRHNEPFLRLAARPWDSVARSFTSLFQADPLGHFAEDPDFFPGSCTGVTVNPADGHTACLILADRESPERNYLAERDVRDSPLGRVQTRITTRDAAITDALYSPDGARIAYVRRDWSDTTEVWVVRAGGSEMSGAKCLEGVFDVAAMAFAPGGLGLVVATKADGVPENTLHFIDMSSDPPSVAEMGAGRISQLPWHPSGQFLLAAALDTEGQSQICMIDGTPPFGRKPLTQVAAGGLTEEAEIPEFGPSISRDGRWAAGRLIIGAENTLVFFDVERLLREPIAAPAPSPSPGGTRRQD